VWDDDWTGLRQWRTLDLLLVESRQVTRQIVEQLSDEEYRGLQLELAARPDAGAVIPGSGGFRRLRWRGSGQGKRGGVRVIYLHRPLRKRIYLAYLFAKSERENLTRREIHLLRDALEGSDE